MEANINNCPIYTNNRKDSSINTKTDKNIINSVEGEIITNDSKYTNKTIK